MSFSSDAKAELCQLRVDKKSVALAECYGALLYGNCFSAREARIITASPDVAERLPRLFKRAFNLGFDLLPPAGAPGKRPWLSPSGTSSPASLRLSGPSRTAPSATMSTSACWRTRAVWRPLSGAHSSPAAA